MLLNRLSVSTAFAYEMCQLAVSCDNLCVTVTHRTWFHFQSRHKQNFWQKINIFRSFRSDISNWNRVNYRSAKSVNQCCEIRMQRKRREREKVNDFCFRGIDSSEIRCARCEIMKRISERFLNKSRGLCCFRGYWRLFKLFPNLKAFFVSW